MKSRLTTFLGNLDGLLALVLAVAAAVLGLTNLVEANVVNNATLLVLGVLAGTVLRDRSKRSEMEQRMVDIGEAIKLAPEVEMLTGSKVGEVLAEARANTEKWTFKGGTGTYLRAVTLKDCIDRARAAKRKIVIRVEIINPTVERVCRQYAVFRKSLPAAGDQSFEEKWDTERAQKEAYATILAACYYKQQYSPLDIEVGLSSVMTTFRWDLSTSCVVMTQEDPEVPAIKMPASSFYYGRWDTELTESFKQAQKVPLDKANEIELGTEPTVEQTRQVFAALGLPLAKTFDDQGVRDIIARALRAKDPYRR